MSIECLKVTLDVITTISTVGIFIVGWYQLYSIRSEAKRERTLSICLAFDIDPVISVCVKKYRETDTDKINPDEHQFITLLNYFDVIAIGEAQGNYDFKIIYPQFKNIIPKTSKDLGVFEHQEKYPDLIKLIDKIEKISLDSNSAK